MKLDISKGGHAQAKDYFGHADYYYHKNKGMSSAELLNWVNSNMKKFSYGPKNQPGGGGLYDMMVKDANQEKQFQQQQDLIKQSQAADTKQLEALTKALENPPYSPSYMASNMSIGNSGNAEGVRARRPKSSSDGTYSLNRKKAKGQATAQSMLSPLSSLIGLKIK